MISLAEVLALSILVALTLYLLLGGADFGGGIWELLASGPRKKEQRELIDGAIAPVWEANHVWLILALVLMFTAFPAAFYMLATKLYIPLSILLLGIVIRGAAFVFRLYGPSPSPIWARLFSWTSLLSPFCLGWCWGVVRSGKPLFSLPAFISGLCVVLLCMYLAAAYLTGETESPELKADFERRFMYVGNPLVLLFLIVAPADIPQAMRLVIFILGFVAFRASQSHRSRLARGCAAACVFALCLGWGMGQYPFLIYPEISIANSAAPHQTLKYLLIALIAGGALLFPSLVALFWIFKKAK